MYYDNLPRACFGIYGAKIRDRFFSYPFCVISPESDRKTKEIVN